MAWPRHCLCVALFSTFGPRASGWAALLLMAPLWVVWLGWTTGLIVFVFDGKSLVELGPFAAVMAAIAIPFELICRLWRHLAASIDSGESAVLGQMVEESGALARWNVDPLLGPWRPHNRLEARMVRWAFDPASKRSAQAAQLDASVPAARAKSDLRRL